MGQDDDLYTNYIPLALHLASDHFLQNDSKDVQLLIACCIADILRVFAPEAPYKDSSHIKVSLCHLFLCYFGKCYYSVYLHVLNYLLLAHLLVPH